MPDIPDMPDMPDEEQLENAVLMEIIERHPAHLTHAELYLLMSTALGGPKSNEIDDSLWALRRFGLVRENGNVLEPTLAALHAVEVIQSV